jgi:flagellar biosynthetic protein FliQ
VEEATLFLGHANQAMWLLALTSMPVLAATLIVGLVVGMIQAATSINEQTLSFVPKLAVTGLVLVLLGGAIMGLIADYTQDIFAAVAEIGR